MTKLLGLFVFLCASASAVTPALIASAIATAGDASAQTLSVTMNCTGANFYSVGVMHNGGVTPAVTDSQGGGTWTGSPNESGDGGGLGRIYYSPARAGGTVTINVFASAFTIIGACFSNTGTAIEHATVQNTCNECFVTLSPAAADILLLTLDETVEGSSPTLETPGAWVVMQGNGLIGGQHIGGAMAYMVTTGAGSQTPTWNNGGTGSSSMTSFANSTATGTVSTTVRRRIIL